MEGNGLPLAGRAFGGGIEPLVSVGAVAVGTAVPDEAAGTAWLTAGDCDTAFSTFTGSAGEGAATALVGRASSVADADPGTCEVARLDPLTAGDCL